MLTVRLTRGRDARDVLTVERADGTSTWEHRPLGFGIDHDMAHLAVEGTLGLEDGFFGTLAKGWNISDFLEKEQRDGMRELPREGAWVEHVVMGLQSEGWGHGLKDAARFNAALASACRGMGLEHRREIGEQELAAINQQFAAAREHWDALAPGDTLSYSLTPGTPGSLVRVETTG